MPLTTSCVISVVVLTLATPLVHRASARAPTKFAPIVLPAATMARLPSEASDRE